MYISIIANKIYIVKYTVTKYILNTLYIKYVYKVYNNIYCIIVALILTLYVIIRIMFLTISNHTTNELFSQVLQIGKY